MSPHSDSLLVVCHYVHDAGRSDALLCDPCKESLMPYAVARLNAALEGRYGIERELGEGRVA